MSRQAVVVDTNVVFKALRLQNSAIRDALVEGHYQFYAPKFLFVELFRHKEKLLRNNVQAEDDLYEYLNGLLQRIIFVNEDTVAVGSYVEAYRLRRGIDENDVPFVALSLELNCPLWTYDQLIRDGLLSRGFTAFFTSSR